MPSPKSIQQIKTSLLHPATTSHFEVKIPFPTELPAGDEYWEDNGVKINQDKLNLLCSEATLPGSNLATLELTNDHTGVTERHAYRRVYDDRIDLTFYVDAENYLPIRFFETWMKYIANESRAVDPVVGASLAAPEYSYRFKYRDDYVSKQGLEVTKFERSSKNYAYSDKYDFKTKSDVITYKFVNAYPISLSSMPISYDSSSLLKCTVSMTYIRYYIDKTVNEGTSSVFSPIEQSKFNSSDLTLPALEGRGALGTNGIPIETANATGNRIVLSDVPGLRGGNFFSE